MLIKDKVVFVTGGARGIGSACAKAVLERGAKVVVTDIDEENGLKETAAFNEAFGLDKAIFIRCDVSWAEDLKEAFGKAVETFGNIDVMINNAGIINELDWNRTLDVNLKGVIHGTELAILLAHMRKDKGAQGGVIINMASVTGYHPYYFFPVYAASKHAIINHRFHKSAPDVTTQGIRYACMCPDGIDTAIVDCVRTHCRQEYKDRIFLPDEWIQPSEVGAAVLTLLEDDHSNDTILEVSAKGMIRRKLIIETA